MSRTTRMTWSKILPLSFVLFPSFVFAAAPTDFKGVADLVRSTLALIPPILIAFAVIAVLYGIIHYVWNGGEEDNRKEGRYFIIWGLIGIFVMVSVWGLVGILSNTFFGVGTQPDFNPVNKVPSFVKTQ